MNAVLTLTTDLGGGLHDVGALYGIVWKTAPATRIVDISHAIRRGDILAAQVLLENALPYFPDDTVHLAITSIADESGQRVLIARLGPMFFAGPDNGLITPLLERAEANRWETEIYQANREQFSQVGETDRMLLATCAALLAGGVPPAALGERISNPIRASLPVPEMLAHGWRGQVLQIDVYGNLFTNIRQAHLEGMSRIHLHIGGQVIEGLSLPAGHSSRSKVEPEGIFAIIDHSNRLGIIQTNGSAAEQFGVKTGASVEVRTA